MYRFRRELFYCCFGEKSPCYNGVALFDVLTFVEHPNRCCKAKVPEDKYLALFVLVMLMVVLKSIHVEPQVQGVYHLLNTLATERLYLYVRNFVCFYPFWCSLWRCCYRYHFRKWFAVCKDYIKVYKMGDSIRIPHVVSLFWYTKHTGLISTVCNGIHNPRFQLSI